MLHELIHHIHDLFFQATLDPSKADDVSLLSKKQSHVLTLLNGCAERLGADGLPEDIADSVVKVTLRLFSQKGILDDAISECVMTLGAVGNGERLIYWNCPPFLLTVYPSCSGALGDKGECELPASFATPPVGSCLCRGPSCWLCLCCPPRSSFVQCRYCFAHARS